MYDFSLPGGEKIALSELIEVLGILQETKFEGVEEFIAEVENVEFSDESLVKVTPVTEGGFLGIGAKTVDWTLESLQSFTSEETLTITMDNGDKIIVNVTDAITYENEISSLLTSATIQGASQNDQGKYVVKSGAPYTIDLVFDEVPNGAQFKTDGPMTYNLQNSGLTVPDTSGSLELAGNNGESVVVAYTISNNIITFNWQDTDSDAFKAFAKSEYGHLEMHILAVVNDDATSIKFSDTIEKNVDVDTTKDVTVNKTGTYNPETKQVDYTVYVTSTGANSNVKVQDSIGGSALTYDSSKFSIESNKNSSVTYNNDSDYTGNGFGIVIPSMQAGEVITINYSASVDFSKLTKNNEGSYGVSSETGNDVIVTSTGNPEHTDHKEGKDLQNKIQVSNIVKTGSEPVDAGNGKKTITWTIRVNEQANVSMNGKSVTDTIAENSRDIMKYSGTGIDIQRVNAAGHNVGSSYHVNWDNMTKSDSSWSYTFNDTENYGYIITYTTEVDASKIVVAGALAQNTVSDEYGTSGGSKGIEPAGTPVTADKDAVHTNLSAKEITWEITFNVPEGGLDSAVVTDTYPFLSSDNSIRDTLKANSIVVYEQVGSEWREFDTTNGERVSIDASDVTKAVLTFYKTVNGTETTGLKGTGSVRNLKVVLTTVANEDWVELAEADWQKTHLNNATVKVNGQNIDVSDSVVLDFTEKSLSKAYVGKEELWDYSTNPAVSRPAFEYQIDLTGVNDGAFDSNGNIIITDTFNAEYLKYEKTTEWWDTQNSFVRRDPLGNNSWADVIAIDDVASANNSTGVITFTLKKSDLVLEDGTYAKKYRIQYYLMVKDAETLACLNQTALSSKGTKVSLNNTASNPDFGTDTVTVDYQPDALGKSKLSEGLNTSTNTYDIKFQVKVNKDGLKIGDEDTVTLTDTFENLSMDYTTVKVYKMNQWGNKGEEDTDVIINRSGWSVIFTLKNEQPYIIEYTSRVIGTGKVHWKNEANLEGIKKSLSDDATVSTSGGGGFSNYSMKVLKHEQGDIKKGLAAKFDLYERVDGGAWSKVSSFETSVQNGEFVIDNNTMNHALYKYQDKTGQRWEYYIVETEAPEGYQIDSTHYEFKIGDTADYSNRVYMNNDVVAIANKPKSDDKTEVTVNKHWESGNHGHNTEVLYSLYRTTEKPEYVNVTVNYPVVVDSTDAEHTEKTRIQTETYQVLKGSSLELFVDHAWWDPYAGGNKQYTVTLTDADGTHTSDHVSDVRDVRVYNWVHYEERVFYFFDQDPDHDGDITGIQKDCTITLDYKNLDPADFLIPVLESTHPDHVEWVQDGSIVTNGSDGSATINNLPIYADEAKTQPYYYFVYEGDLNIDDTKDIDRYKVNYSHQYVTAIDDSADTENGDTNTITITNEMRPEYTWVGVHKRWQNIENVPDSITVVLYRRAKTADESTAPSWFDNLVVTRTSLKDAIASMNGKYNVDNVPEWAYGWYALDPSYDYFIAETNVDGTWFETAPYTIQYTDLSGNALTSETHNGHRYFKVDGGAAYNIVNRNTGVSVAKEWYGDGAVTIDGTSYTKSDFVIELKLTQYIDGVKQNTITGASDGDYNVNHQHFYLDGTAETSGNYRESSAWTYSWQGLPAEGSNGEEITYVAEEIGVYRKGTDGNPTGDNLLNKAFVPVTSKDGQTITNYPAVDVPVEKTWADFVDSQYDWSTTFRLQWAPLYEGQTKPTTNFADVTPAKEITITKSMMAKAGADGETAEQKAARSFEGLPMYGVDNLGRTYRIQYSLDELSYEVKQNGTTLYTWAKGTGYNTEDETTHYDSFYPHDAGEDSDQASDYYIAVTNAKKNIREKEYIDTTLKKEWDSSFKTDDSSYAEFELRRYVHTEYRDLSRVEDEDRLADPITVTLKDGSGNTVGELSVLRNTGLYVAGTFAPRTSTKTFSFRIGSGEVTTVTANGANAGKEIVRSDEFFLTEDTVITLVSGVENLDGGVAFSAQLLDTAGGTNAIPDTTYTGPTIRLDNSNHWTWTAEENSLLFRETLEGDSDDNENVNIYGYYFVEKGSNPEGIAQFFLADGNGDPTEVVTGDAANRIYADNQTIIAFNAPKNRLQVEKEWRGVPDTTGYPAVTFTLYQGWANYNNTAVSSNNGDSWVYVNDAGESYVNVELKDGAWTWTCPENLPTTKEDPNNPGNFRNVGYYVKEDVTSGQDGNTKWSFYYYVNSDKKQTNSQNSAADTGILGTKLNESGGKITIVNKLDQYLQMDIKKQFFTLGDKGSWANTTSANYTNTVLGFKVIRAVKDADGNWLDEKGNVSSTAVWSDYGDELLCGYDENGKQVTKNGGANDFNLEPAGGDWHFRINQNGGDENNRENGQIGLPANGYYVKNGESVPVSYAYSFRETNVYKDLNRTPYDNWDWFSSITPDRYVDKGGQHSGEFGIVFKGQDGERIANFQASDLTVTKNWVGETEVQEVYVKIYRIPNGSETVEDFTAVIAEDIKNNKGWQNYLSDPNDIDTDKEWLVIKNNGNGSWTTSSILVNNALLGSVDKTVEDFREYTYYIEEVGYKDKNGTVQTDVSKFKPSYSKLVDGSMQTTGSDPTSAAIRLGNKGENKLAVANSTEPTADYTVTKKWLDTATNTDVTEQMTDAEVTVTLKRVTGTDAEGKETLVDVTSDYKEKAVVPTVTLNKDGWTHTWKNLPTEDAAGNAITYRVVESDVKIGGKSFDANPEITENGTSFTVTNKVKSVLVQKRFQNGNNSGANWIKGYDESKAVDESVYVGEVYFKLYKMKEADGKLVPDYAVNEYGEKEDKIFTITKNDTTTAINDFETDGVKIITKGDTLTWVYTFSHLPAGVDYQPYEVDKDGSVEFKMDTTDGTMFCTEQDVNLSVMKNIMKEITAQKEWKDKDNTVSHPDITFELYKKVGNGNYVKVDSKVFSDDASKNEAHAADNKHAFPYVTWSNLPEYDYETGDEISYYVKEVCNSNAYKTSQNGNIAVTKSTDGDGNEVDEQVIDEGKVKIDEKVDVATITFINELETVDYNVTKNWAMPNGQKVPDGITATLYLYQITSDGTKSTVPFKTVTLNGVAEDKTAAAAKDAEGTEGQEGYKPAEAAKEAWDDAGNSQSAFEVTPWHAWFRDLPKYDAEGNAYSYQITEKEITGYTVKYRNQGAAVDSDYLSGNGDITNTPITTDVKAQKKWTDNQAHSGDTSYVTLYKYVEGEKIITVNVANPVALGSATIGVTINGETKTLSSAIPSITFTVPEEDTEYNVAYVPTGDITLTGEQASAKAGDVINLTAVVPEPKTITVNLSNSGDFGDSDEIVVTLDGNESKTLNKTTASVTFNVTGTGSHSLTYGTGNSAAGLTVKASDGTSEPQASAAGGDTVSVKGVFSRKIKIQLTSETISNLGDGDVIKVKLDGGNEQQLTKNQTSYEYTVTDGKNHTLSYDKGGNVDTITAATSAKGGDTVDVSATVKSASSSGLVIEAKFYTGDKSNAIFDAEGTPSSGKIIVPITKNWNSYQTVELTADNGWRVVLSNLEEADYRIGNVSKEGVDFKDAWKIGDGNEVKKGKDGDTFTIGAIITDKYTITSDVVLRIIGEDSSGYNWIFKANRLYGPKNQYGYYNDIDKKIGNLTKNGQKTATISGVPIFKDGNLLQYAIQVDGLEDGAGHTFTYSYSVNGGTWTQNPQNGTIYFTKNEGTTYIDVKIGDGSVSTGVDTSMSLLQSTRRPVASVATAPRRAAANAAPTYTSFTGDLLDSTSNISIPDVSKMTVEDTHSGTGNWSKEWKNLPAYTDDGKKITYYVVETRVDTQTGYTSMTAVHSYTDTDDTRNVEIKNTPGEEGKTNVSASKVWKDSDGSAIIDSNIVNSLQVKFGLYEGENLVTVDGQDNPAVITGNGTITWTGLDNTKTYTVKETSVKLPGMTEFVDTSTSNPYQDSTVAGNQADGFTITNKLPEIALNLIKVDKNNSSKTLEKAEFILWKIDGASTTISKVGEAKTATTDEDGTGSISELKAGYYMLQETKSPDGYVKTGDGTVYFKVEAGTITFLTYADGTKPSEWATNDLSGDDLLSFTATSNTLIVANEPGVALPSTGGPGTNLIYLLGSILILGAGVLLWRRRRLV